MAEEAENKLPKEALNLFDSLIHNLINSTEKLSFQQKVNNQENQPKSRELASVGSKASSTVGPPFDHSFLTSNKQKSKEKCRRNDVESVAKTSSKESTKVSQKCQGNCGNSVQTDEVTDESTTSPSLDQKLDMLLKNEDVAPHWNAASKKASSVCQACVALEKLRAIDKFVEVKCCDADSSLTSRIAVGKDSGITVQSRNSTIGQPVEQKAYLTTRRLAKDRDGCEVTFSTTDPEGQPIVIRALCPDFEPTKVWLNGKAYEYIESESLTEPSAVDSWSGTKDSCSCLEEEETLISGSRSTSCSCCSGSMNSSLCSCSECQSLCSCSDCQTKSTLFD